MKIVKPHPAWIEQERDFDCPSCKGPLTDNQEREHVGDDECEKVLCPHCFTPLEVKREVRVSYAVKEIRA